MGGKRYSPFLFHPMQLTQPSCRNAAKARTRDVVGRQQKGFFGRQRLNILSKGLQTSTPKLSRDASDPRAKEEITLAHAHSKHIPEPQSPLHKSPSTPPPWKKQRVLMEAHTSSSGASGSSRRQSKVLDALDIEERESPAAFSVVPLQRLAKQCS